VNRARSRTTDRKKAEDKRLDNKRTNYSEQYVPYECKRTFNRKYDEYQYGEWRFNKTRVFVTPET